MTHLTHEEKMQYTQLFLQIDDEFGDKTGALDIKAFEKFLIASGYRLSKQRVAEVFCNADLDGNWKITLEEFLARQPQIAPRRSPEARASDIRRRFEKSDVNHDGCLSFDELIVLMGGIQDDEDALRELVSGMIDKWDGDGDGKINFEEFLTMYLEADLEEEDFADIDAAEAEEGEEGEEEEEGETKKGEEDQQGKEQHTELKPEEEQPAEEEQEKSDSVSSSKEEEPEKSDSVSASKGEEPEKSDEVSVKNDVQEKQEERNRCGVERKDGERVVGGGVNVKSMTARLEKMTA